jgi:hypothetical protein
MLKALGSASAEATTSPKRYIAGGVATKPMLLWPTVLLAVLSLIGTPGADLRCTGICIVICGGIAGVLVVAIVIIHRDRASVENDLGMIWRICCVGVSGPIKKLPAEYSSAGSAIFWVERR